MYLQVGVVTGHLDLPVHSEGQRGVANKVERRSELLAKSRRVGPLNEWFPTLYGFFTEFHGVEGWRRGICCWMRVWSHHQKSLDEMLSLWYKKHAMRTLIIRTVQSTLAFAT